MFRKALFLAIALPFVGCTTARGVYESISTPSVPVNAHSRDPVVEPPPDYSALSSAVVGGNVDQKRKQESTAKPAEGKQPRIRLDPTPGDNRKGPWAEVLTSGPSSDYYVAETLRVPKTRFFRILRDANCDQRVFLTFINPKMVQANPAYITSGKYRDQEPLYQCEVAFHHKFDRGDEELAGADGVIFDGSQQVADGKENSFPLVTNMKIFIRGYAIKFDDPTPEDIEQHLSKRAIDRIEILQLKAVLYWIEKQQALQYRDKVRALLPKEGSSRNKPGWNEADLAVLRALAALGDDAANHPVWLGILRDGISSSPRANPRRPISPPGSGGEAAMIAANALTCAKDPNDVAELFRIAMRTDLSAYKMAVSKALMAYDRTDLIEKIIQNLDDASMRMILGGMASKTAVPFQCPYRNTYYGI